MAVIRNVDNIEKVKAHILDDLQVNVVVHEGQILNSERQNSAGGTP